MPETTAPTPAPTAEQLTQRVNDLDRRTRELQEQTPSSVERAHRLLEDANALEVDIQEVLTQLSSDLETPDDTDENGGLPASRWSGDCYPHQLAPSSSDSFPLCPWDTPDSSSRSFLLKLKCFRTLVRTCPNGRVKSE